MRATSRTRSVIAGLTLSCALAACGGDDNNGGFSPTMDNVARSYHATTFTLQNGATRLDLLQLGASVNVTLTSDGHTSGQLLVPGFSEGGGTLDEDLAGTWSLSGNTVTFSQSTGTLIQGAQFTAQENTLAGSGAVEAGTVSIVLSKSS